MKITKKKRKKNIIVIQYLHYRRVRRFAMLLLMVKFVVQLLMRHCSCPFDIFQHFSRAQWCCNAHDQCFFLHYFFVKLYIYFLKEAFYKSCIMYTVTTLCFLSLIYFSYRNTKHSHKINIIIIIEFLELYHRCAIFSIIHLCT